MRRKVSSWLVLALTIAGLAGISACGGGSGAVQVTAVAVTPTSVSVPINTTTTFTAAVTLSNSSNNTTTTTITWYVNGIAGGDINTVGSIGVSAVDALQGVYTAPSTVPTSGVTNGEVTITATTPQVPGSTTNSTLITSNMAELTVTAGTGLSVSPTTAQVPAGGSQQFNAILNNENDTAVTWSVSSTVNGDTNIGTIDSTGLYTAPPNPPTGNSITITATAGNLTATSTLSVVFSDHSLTGPYAFSYSGNDQTGFVAVAGSFQADGAGHIVSGVEDVDNFGTGPSTQISISGTYVVGPDGRGTAKINVGSGSGAGQGTVDTWQFVLTSYQHALLTRFDVKTTGSGTIDQQNLNGLTTSPAALSGPYVFSVSGGDKAFYAQGMAGKFTANGGGTISGGNAILDVNDSLNPTGAVTTGDRTLSGTYAMDPTFPGSGRGTITLTSATTGPVQYAFYIVNTTASEQSTQMHVVEIDGNNYLGGDIYGGLTGASFTPATLTAGNYAFTVGGNSTGGAYSEGGVFVSSGAGATSSGVVDSNNAGTVTADTTLGSCTYAVDATTGRIDLKLNLASGTCSGGASATTQEFAAYQTAQGSAVMLELDSTALATGAAYQQTAIPTIASTDHFSFRLAGQGIFHNAPASYQQNLSGEVSWGTGCTASSGTSCGGTIDISSYSAVNAGDPINAATTVVTTAPDTTTGRGEVVIAGMNPNVTYNATIYVIDDNTALLFDSDTGRILIGTVGLQY
ncbi:MAG: hypothetical protein WCA00_09720 [Candidatus Acidiferrales bacterium]